MLGSSEKPDGCDGTFTLNQGFKGYSLRRHLGDSLLFRFIPPKLIFGFCRRVLDYACWYRLLTDETQV